MVASLIPRVERLAKSLRKVPPNREVKELERRRILKG